jgi:hypothetical protein
MAISTNKTGLGGKKVYVTIPNTVSVILNTRMDLMLIYFKFEYIMKPVILHLVSYNISL